MSDCVALHRAERTTRRLDEVLRFDFAMTGDSTFVFAVANV
jgi:hypothetical protein